MRCDALIRRLAAGVCLLCVTTVAVFAAEEPVIKPIRSDGSLIHEPFDGNAIPDGWTPVGKAYVVVKDSWCRFNPGLGDNYLHLPAFKSPRDQPVVFELAIQIPALTKGDYTLLQIERSDGSFAVTLQPAAEGNRVVIAGKQLGALKPGVPARIGLRCLPGGQYEGMLTAPYIERPFVRKVSGPQGAINRVCLGNVANAGDGSLHVDEIKVGRDAAE